MVSLYNTRSTQKSPVRQQMHGSTQESLVRHKNDHSTQKCPTHLASVDIAIIKHPPPFLKLLSKLDQTFYIKEARYEFVKNYHCQNGAAVDPLWPGFHNVLNKNLVIGVK